MYPRRSSTTHTEQLGDEASVYDWARTEVHALNPIAARVWRQCDGATSPEAIAAVLRLEMGIPEAEAVVDLALTQLARVHLLELPVESRGDRPTISRRWLLGRGVAAAMLPAIYSIVAPSPLEAQSPAGAPTLTAISPAQGTQGATVMVTLTGTNFIAGGTTVNVSGTGITVTVLTVSSNTSLKRTTSRTVNSVSSNTLLTANFALDGAAALGARNVTVTTVNGTTAPLSFTVNAPVPAAAPTLTSVSPNQGIQGATEAVTLTGTNFVVGATTVTAAGSGVTVTNVTVSSSTSLTANFVLDAAAALGARNVTVTTAGGTSAPIPFTVNAPAPGAPTLISVSPNQGLRGTTVAVTMTGTNFVVGATTVGLAGGGVTVSNVVVGSSTSLTANFVIDAAAALGGRNVTVTTANGTSGAEVFAVNPPAPTLTNVSPSQGTRGTTVAVTLTGTNFVVGTTTVTVAGGGATVNNVVVGSSTSLSADFVLDLNASGPRTVTVTTAGGTSGPQSFTISLPPPGSTTFVFSGSPRTFIVPAGVVSVTIVATGGEGGIGFGSSGNAGGAPGLGGRTTATVSVTPAASLTVLVGGVGRDGLPDFTTAGGFNGGGGSAGDGGGGGGASSVYSGATPLVVVGGAGGGGAESGGVPPAGGNGAAGGGLLADPGQGLPSGGGGGGGGTQAAGGAGGAKSSLSGTDGTAGVAGQGGTGGAHQQPGVIGGGGGGGGYFGGGGGGGGNPSGPGGGGGGGGSSFAAPGATNVLHEQGVKASNGFVTISW